MRRRVLTSGVVSPGMLGMLLTDFPFDYLSRRFKRSLEHVTGPPSGRPTGGMIRAPNLRNSDKVPCLSPWSYNVLVGEKKGALKPTGPPRWARPA